MKKILFFLLISSFHIAAQNKLLNQQEDSLYHYTINAKLTNFERSKNVKDISNLHYTIGGFGKIYNRTLNSSQWKEQMNTDIAGAMQILNRIGNYPNFDFIFDRQKLYGNIEQPKCFEQPKFVSTGSIRMRNTARINLSDIKDEDCKKKYIDYYKNIDLLDKDIEYQKATRELYSNLIVKIIYLFDDNKYTSLDEIDNFVLPKVEKYIDTPKKQAQFRKDFAELVNITKLKPLSQK